jgi:iron complex outermembrane recepter protein
MTSIRMRTLCAATSILALAAVARPAFAQGQAPAAADNSNPNDIVVTAQRTSQKLMDVPLSIVAQSGDQLQTNGIKQMTDLQFTTPGYNVSDSNGYTQIFIRGVGNAEFVGADPSVATFIDDVPRIYGSMVNNFVDVERVEVLKGAQGGLYGRNATGGVINIITKQPSTDGFKMDGRLTYASHNTFEAAAYINIPLGDKAAFSVAGDRRSSDPYFKNLAPASFYTPAMFTTGVLGMTPAASAAFFNSGQKNADVGNQNFWAVDGKLLLKPTENLKITIAGDYSNKDDSQGNAQWENSPAYEQGTFKGLFGFLVGELGGAANLAAFPANFLQGNPPKFQVSNGGPGFVRLKDWGVSGTAVLTTDSVDFTSITAFRKQHTQFIDDLGASTLASTAALVDNHKHYFYQELRAVSHMPGPFQFIVGGSYLKNFFQGYTDLQLFGGILGGSPLARSTDKVENWSIYAQLSYELTSQLTLTASGRYIHEKNTAQFFDLSTNPNPNIAFVNPTGSPVSATESKFLPSATLSYKLDGGGNIYVRYARGFKSGGVNPVANAANFCVPAGSATCYPDSGSVFKGETVDTFEGGVKAPLFNNKVQLTADVFYNSYKNLQTAGHVNAANANTIILTIINAPSARTYGVEGTLNWRVTPEFTLAANAGYLNAKYKNFKLPTTPILNGFDLSGTQMINAPEFQFSVAANLDKPITSSLNILANVLASYTSKVNYQVSGTPCGVGGIVGVTCLPDAIGPSYWVVNARLGIKASDGKWTLSAFANNLFNAAYVTYGNSNAANTTQFTWGNPRIVGVEGTVKF